MRTKNNQSDEISSMDIIEFYLNPEALKKQNPKIFEIIFIKDKTDPTFRSKYRVADNNAGDKSKSQLSPEEEKRLRKATDEGWLKFQQEVLGEEVRVIKKADSPSLLQRIMQILFINPISNYAVLATAIVLFSFSLLTYGYIFSISSPSSSMVPSTSSEKLSYWFPTSILFISLALGGIFYVIRKKLKE
ncbi:MAG: hypothetical protein IPL26_16835 [Leptospiraceae bacterium]|nr:hypothetical protein [Leptospiraceae bacterium]